MNEIENIPELSSQPGRLSIPGLDAWRDSVQGRYVLNWEQAALDTLVSDIFGFNAIQLGLPEFEFLRANRIPLRQRAGETGQVDVRCDYTALPFASQSIDLVVLPHVLEFSANPHEILREVERILIPEGQIIVIGFNPLSLWGIKRRLNRSAGFPWNGRYLSLPRLRDWLKLLAFEVDDGTLGCYVPPFGQRKWLQRWRWIDGAAQRSWRFAGAVYVVRAIKRTRGMHLITPPWKTATVKAKALRPVAQKGSK